MRHLKTMLAVLGAVTVLVLAGNTIALATTGHSFILGKSNSASKVTSLARTTSGTALSIHTKSTGNAPLQVNGHGKVANLNADMVDGLHGSALQTRTYVFTRDVTTPTTQVQLTAAVPAGTYLINYSAYMTASPATSMGEVDCYLKQASGFSPFLYAGESDFPSTLQGDGVTGGGVLTKYAHTGANLYLICGVNVPFVTPPHEPIQMTLTRIDVASSASARTVSGGARLAH